MFSFWPLAIFLDWLFKNGPWVMYKQIFIINIIIGHKD